MPSFQELLNTWELGKTATTKPHKEASEKVKVLEKKAARLNGGKELDAVYAGLETEFDTLLKQHFNRWPVFCKRGRFDATIVYLSRAVAGECRQITQSPCRIMQIQGTARARALA